MAAEAKKIRTETGKREQDEKMDTQFRNPNAASAFETGRCGFYIDTGTPNLVGPSVVNTGASALSASGNVELTDTYKEKLKDYRGKIAFKKNHIWGEIANAEAVEETVKQFDVVSMVDVFSISRGPETYVVGARRKRKLPEEGEVAVKPTPTRVADDDYESDSSISSGGLSDDTNKDLKVRYAARKSSSRGGRKIIKSRKSIVNDTTQSPQSVDSEMTVDVKPKKKSVGRSILEEKMAEKPDYKLAFDMAKRLNERKKHLFSNAMKLLGRETCIKLFFKTLKIERLGGMMIKNNSRRRTPGGVFLYMIRKDSRLPKEAVLEIFKDEREFIRVSKRKACPENTQKWENKVKGRILAKFDKSAELQDPVQNPELCLNCLCPVTTTKETNSFPEAQLKGFSRENIYRSKIPRRPTFSRGRSLMEAKNEGNEGIDSDVEADEIENSYDLPATAMQTDDSAGVRTEDLKLLKREKVVYEDISEIPDP